MGLVFVRIVSSHSIHNPTDKTSVHPGIPKSLTTNAYLQFETLIQLLISERDREGPKAVWITLFFEFFGPKCITKAGFKLAIVNCYAYH